MPRTIPIALAGLLLAGCSNPFAPDVEKVTRRELPPAPEATTAQVVMDNLERAFDDPRQGTCTRTLLDDAFWFTEADCRGDLLYYYGKEEELRIMGPSRRLLPRHLRHLPHHRLEVPTLPGATPSSASTDRP